MIVLSAIPTETGHNQAKYLRMYLDIVCSYLFHENTPWFIRYFRIITSALLDIFVCKQTYNGTNIAHNISEHLAF